MLVNTSDPNVVVSLLFIGVLNYEMSVLVHNMPAVMPV